PGRVLRGRVVDADGQPVSFCEVEVRDPSGNRLPSPRQTVSAEDGTFGVEGLADGTYTIQAHDLRDGRTFSGQTRGAQPGRDTWEVVLRDEDPARPGSRAEKRGGP
ncbi:MAG: carboxypeptidase-like regulatory domain-containing protein, partial [Planctomycetota bacterium]